MSSTPEKKEEPIFCISCRKVPVPPEQILCVECFYISLRNPLRCCATVAKDQGLAFCLRPKAPDSRVCRSCYEAWKKKHPFNLAFDYKEMGGSPVPREEEKLEVKMKRNMKECPDGVHCQLTDYEHVTRFLHPDVKYPVPVCPDHPKCEDMNPVHRRQFKHPLYRLPYMPVLNANMCDCLYCVEQSKPYFKDFYMTDFFENEEEFRGKLDSFIGANCGGYPVNTKPIRDWFAAIEPVHMCRKEVFKSILKMGGLSSMRSLVDQWCHPEQIAESVVRRAAIEEKEVITLLGNSLKLFKDKYLVPFIRTVEQERLATWVDQSQARKIAAEYASRTPPCVAREMKTRKCRFAGIIGSANIEKMENLVREAVDAIVDISKSQIGVDYDADKKLRTDFSVFTILGYHAGNYGDCEVMILLKREVMYHPDFNMTTQAATSYCGNNANWCHDGFSNDRRGWMGENPPRVSRWTPTNPPSTEPGLVAFRKERFSPAILGWEDDMAKEAICRVFSHSMRTCHGFHYLKGAGKGVPTPPPAPCLVDPGKAMKDISFEDMHKLFLSYPLFGAHLSPEGHVSGNVPLYYIDKIIIQQRSYEALRAMKDRTVEAFFDDFLKNRPTDLIIVPGEPPAIIDMMHSTLWDVAARQEPPCTAPQGFTFTVSPTLRYNVDIPVKIMQDRNVLNFSVVGGSFAFYLSNFPGVECPGDRDRMKMMLYVFFDHLSGEITTRSVYNGSEAVGSSCHLYNPSLKTLPSEEDTLSWRLVVDSSPNRERSLQFTLFSNEHMIAFKTPGFKIPENFEELNYICFAPYNKEYTIWNLTFERNEDE